jgi:DNA polymerase-3 subunit epsilon
VSIIYIDVETTGLDPERHEVIEIGWVDGDRSGRYIVPHLGITADPEALRINKYNERGLWDRSLWDEPDRIADLANRLEGRTLAGCNPRFDAAFLSRLFGREPWHYRLLDVQSYASAVLGELVPLSASDLYAEYSGRGHALTEPDHTALSDALFAQGPAPRGRHRDDQLPPPWESAQVHRVNLTAPPRMSASLGVPLDRDPGGGRESLHPV